MSLERTIAHVMTRQAQVRAEFGPARSIVVDTGRRFSGVIGTNPIRAKKLSDDLGHGLTNLRDLQAEVVQLDHAEHAIRIKGSAKGIAVVPAGKRIVVDLREDLGAPKINAPTVVPTSKTSK